MDGRGVAGVGFETLTRCERPEEDEVVVSCRAEILFHQLASSARRGGEEEGGESQRTSTSQPPPIGRNLTNRHRPSMPNKDTHTQPLLDVPQPEGTVRRTGGEVERVGVEGEALSVRRQEEKVSLEEREEGREREGRKERDGRTLTSLKCPAKILTALTFSVVQSLAVLSLLALAK